MPRLTTSLALVLFGWLLLAAPAQADCPIPNPSHFDSCGPTFTLPAWGDAAGWDDPSKYSTIQLADVNGDGKDELLGRGDGGLEIWRFDTSVGQWRPQVDADAVPQILTDFRSPLPSEDFFGWKQPQYYSTIQTANLDGKPGVEVIARFGDGMRAYGYTPPAGGNSIDGGTWSTLATGGPFADRDGWADPQFYSTIRSVVAGGRAYLIAHDRAGMIAYEWAGEGWRLDSQTNLLSGCSDPACYTSVKFLPPGAGGVLPANSDLVAADPANSMGQTVLAFQGPGRGWQRVGVGESYFASGPLSNDRLSPDCPLSGNLCFPQIAALYETTRWPTLLGGGPELVALGPRGLLVYDGEGGMGGSVIWDNSRPTLTDLAYPASQWGSDPGKAASLMAANIDGQGSDEILALQDGALQAWSYNRGFPGNDFWTRLQPTTPLALSDTSVWNTDASHYSTFRHGDVDGDGREDIIARGPFGIRTWFWNRRGTGGWERYLSDGYPAFSGGQAAAFANLTDLAKTHGVIVQGASSVRDVWTGEIPPEPSDLTNLQQGVLSIANCTGLLPGEPPRYQTCALAGAGFSAADWTAVINEVLAEIFAAGQVIAHFKQLDMMRQEVFIEEGAEFPKIGDDLGLQAAANTQTTYNMAEFWSGLLEIAGALASLLNPEAGAALFVAGDVLAMVPSATPSATSQYSAAYDGVQGKFAASISDADKAQAVLSQTVRQDYGLLTLVGMLRQEGTWDPDLVGLGGAAKQAFAGWVYESLLPVIYDRYEITGCTRWAYGPCYGPSEGATYPGVVGSANGPNFTMLGPPPANIYAPDAAPCFFRYTIVHCNFTSLPSDLANRIFGPLSSSCDYMPPGNATVWTFEDCTLGLNAYKTVGPLGPANGWNFTTCAGDPFGDPWPDTCNSPTTPTRHAVGARQSVRVTGVLRVPRGFAFRRARAVATRVLYEPLGRGELARPPQTPTSRPRGSIRSARTAAGPRARVKLRRLGPRRLRFDLRTRRSGLRVPRACAALPRSVQPRMPIVRLETRLRLSDGRRAETRVLRGDFKCVRDRLGNISQLRTVTRRVRRWSRPGLRSALRLPSVVRPGGTALARLTLRNARRPAPGSTLWHLAVTATGFEPRRVAGVSLRRTVRRLRAGRSTRVLLRLPVPRSAQGRFCVRTVTTADLARASSSRRCARVRRAGPPGVTG